MTVAALEEKVYRFGLPIRAVGGGVVRNGPWWPWGWGSRRAMLLSRVASLSRDDDWGFASVERESVYNEVVIGDETWPAIE